MLGSIHKQMLLYKTLSPNSWPVGAWIVSIGALLLDLTSKSIMVPRYELSPNEGLLPKKIAETNKNALDLPLLFQNSGIVLLFSGKFEELAALSVVFRFFQYIPNCSSCTSIKYPDKKVVFRVPFGPVIPILAVLVSLVMIWGESNELRYGLIGVLIASAVYFIYIVLICKK